MSVHVHVHVHVEASAQLKHACVNVYIHVLANSSM